ncbi:hypothetical protein [Ornithinibacillus contaminans]|uniref:hypothetical protein n=1 Tax=Ornithinibacillus contaminans TaxID=694055 RepID=UPI00064D92E9|nr:hypothetical protein [Ornithinibacillus contaminans]
MSENKRVIRVKDLVIQADNVIIEPARRRDPILGGLRRTNDERVESINREVESNEREGKDRDRGPFSWI